VDDVRDLAQVEELAGVCADLKVLVTTRNADLGVLAPGVGRMSLRPLDPEASVALLRSRGGGARDEDVPVLREVASDVGHLPLALEMLAVRLTRPRQTPQRVLEGLRRAPNPVELDVFTSDPAGATVPRKESVYAALAGTVQGLDGESRDQLKPLGYIADAPVPEALALALTGLGGEALGRLLERAQAQSVLSWAAEGAAVVHTLTAAAIRSLDRGASLEAAAARALERLSAISTNDPAALRLEVAHHERVLGHLRGAPRRRRPVPSRRRSGT
jgi:hypothetical protein